MTLYHTFFGILWTFLCTIALILALQNPENYDVLIIQSVVCAAAASILFGMEVSNE